MPDVSWSKIKRWRRCRKSYDYRYNQHLIRKRKAVPLFRGSLLHEMLSSQALKALHPKAPRPSPDDILRIAQKQYRLFLREEKEMHGDIINDVRRVFEAYNRTYAQDVLVPLSSEEFFSTPITPDIKFIGYIDNRVQDQYDVNWIRDYKTCTNLPDEEARFSDTQLILYAWAWNRENPTKSVHGVTWDYLRTKPPTIPEVLKNGELTKRANIDSDYFTYWSEIKRLGLDPKDYKDILGSLKAKRSPSFMRVKYPIPPKATMDTIVEDLRTSAIEIQVMGKSHTPRTMAYDCKGCEHFLICQAELRGLDANYIRKTEYQIKENDHGEAAHEDAKFSAV